MQLTYGMMFVTTERSTRTENCPKSEGVAEIATRTVCTSVITTIPAIGTSLRVTFLKMRGK